MLVKQLAAPLGFPPASERPALAHGQICQADLLCASAQAEEALVPLEPAPYQLDRAPRPAISRLQVGSTSSPLLFRTVILHRYLVLHLRAPFRPHRRSTTPIHLRTTSLRPPRSAHVPTTPRPSRILPCPSGRLVPPSRPHGTSSPYDSSLAAASSTRSSARPASRFHLLPSTGLDSRTRAPSSATAPHRLDHDQAAW